MEFKGWHLAYLKSMDKFKPGLTLKINRYEYEPSCLLCQLTWIIRLKVSDSFFFSSSALDREQICSCIPFISKVLSSSLVVTWMAGEDKLGTWIFGSTIQKKYHKWNKTFFNSDREKKVIFFFFFFFSSMYVVKIRVFGKISKNFFCVTMGKERWRGTVGWCSLSKWYIQHQSQYCR